MSTEHLDVVIVGAGLSGIGTACHLERELPDHRYAVLEAREDLGGTWSLFRYPGIRSDSGHQPLTCSFLLMCSGYYRYDQGSTPDLPGLDRFGGTVVHPQLWDPELDHAGKRVVVIGSGATAVTLVPALLEEGTEGDGKGNGGAAHVTMLQRSPSYVLSIGRTDVVAVTLSRLLPRTVADPLTRAKNIVQIIALYQLRQRFPRLVRGLLRNATQFSLPRGYDVDTHFNPSYDPWDQRMCMVPDGDLFRSIRQGRADIVTDHSETFTGANSWRGCSMDSRAR